jgi:putative oxidoreductase
MTGHRAETVGSLPLAVPHADRRADSPGVDAALLLGRILLGAIFVMSGYGKLTGLEGFTASLQSQGVPFAPVMAVLAGAIEFTGGLLVVLGFQARLGALCLVVFTIAATLIAHRFWEFDGAAYRGQQIQFSKNLSIIGGLLFVAAVGAGRFGLDGLRHRRIG